MSNSNNEEIKLIIDAENLSSDELNKAAKDIDGLGAAARQTEKDLKQLKIDSAIIGSYEKMGLEVEELQKSVRAAELDFEDLDKALKKNKNSTREQREEVKKAKQEYENQKKSLTSVSNEYRKLGKSVKNIQKDSESTTDTQSRLAKQLEKTTNKLKAQNKVQKERTELFKKQEKELKDLTEVREELEAIEAKADKNAERRIKSRVKAFNQKRKEAAETLKLNTALKKYEQQLKELNKEKNKGSITTAGYIKQEEKLRKELKLTASQAKATKLAVESDSKTLDKKSKSTDLLTSATRRLAQAYTVLLAAQKSIEAVSETVQGYGELESAITRVEKTTGIAREQVVGMADELRDMSENITPSATNELLRYAEVAGQMGVSSSESILQIVAAADALAVSTDLAGDEAALLTARILGMTGQGVDDIHNLASAMVELGNSTKTSESEIAHMTKEIVTGTRAINFSAEAAAGFGATLKELGQPAERSRSAMSDLTNVILDLANEGGEGLEQLMATTRLTADEIEKSLGDDSELVTIKFIEGLKRAKDAGITLRSSLANVGITSKETNVVVGVLADNTDRLSRNVHLSVEAYRAGNKHFEEAAKAYSDQDAVLARLANKFTTLKTKIGEAFNPTVLESAEHFGEVLEDNEDAIVDAAAALPDLIKGVVELSNAFTGITTAFTSDDVGIVERVATGWTHIFNATSIALNNNARGMITARKAMAEFFGATERELLEYDKQIHEVSSRIQTDQDDIRRNTRVMSGETTNAYEDMVEAIRKNGEAVGALSEEQQKNIKALSNIKTVNKSLNEEYRKASTLIARKVTELKLVNEQEKKANETAVKSKQVNDEKAVSLQKISKELNFLTTQQVQLEKLNKQGILTDSEYRQVSEDLTNSIKTRQASMVSLINTSGENNEQSKTSKGIAESWIEVDGKRIAMTELLNQTTSNQTQLNINQADSLTLLSGEVLKGAELTKYLTEQRNGMVVSSEFFNDSLVKSSEAVRKLTLDERNLVTTIAELKEKIAASNTQVKEKIALTLQLQGVEEQLIKTKEQKAIIEDLEGKRARELRVEQNITLRELKNLDFQYKTGAITAGEYADKTELLKFKLAELNKVMGDVIPTTAELAQKNTALASSANNAATAEGNLREGLRERGQATGVATTLMNHYLKTMERYNKVHDYSGASTKEMTKRLDELQDELIELSRNTMPSSLIGLDNFLYKMEKLTRESIASEQAAIKQTISIESLINEVKSGTLSIDQLSHASARANYYFSELSDNQLDPLRQAIESAKEEFARLADEIDDTFDTVQDRLDELTGNESDILERKFKREMEELEDLLERATASGNAALVRKIRQAIADLKKAQAIERKQASERDRNDSSSEYQPPTSSGTVNEYNVNITLPNGRVKQIGVTSQADANDLVSILQQLGEVNINGVG